MAEPRDDETKRNGRCPSFRQVKLVNLARRATTSWACAAVFLSEIVDRYSLVVKRPDPYATRRLYRRRAAVFLPEIVDRYSIVVKRPDPYAARHLYRRCAAVFLPEIVDRYSIVGKRPDPYAARHLYRRRAAVFLPEIVDRYSIVGKRPYPYAARHLYRRCAAVFLPEIVALRPPADLVIVDYSANDFHAASRGSVAKIEPVARALACLPSKVTCDA